MGKNTRVRHEESINCTTYVRDSLMLCYNSKNNYRKIIYIIYNSRSIYLHFTYYRHDCLPSPEFN